MDSEEMEGEKEEEEGGEWEEAESRESRERDLVMVTSWSQE